MCCFASPSKTNNKPENKKPRNQKTKKKQETNKLKNQETKQRKNKQKTKKQNNQKSKIAHAKGRGVVAESWVLSFFQTFFCGFLFFFGSWFCLAIAQKINNEPENKKPKNKKNKKIGKKTRLHTPRGGVVAESWVLSFFQMVFCGFLSFFGSWFCLAIAQKKSTTNQKTRNQETKKTKKDKKPKNKKNKHNRKKTRLHTPRGGVVAESWVLSFFQTFFCGFLFFFWILVLFSHCTKNQQRTRKQETKKPKKQKTNKKQKKKTAKKNRKNNKIAHPKGGE